MAALVSQGIAVEQINAAKAPPLEEPRMRIEPTVEVQTDLKIATTELPNLEMRHAPTMGDRWASGVGRGLGRGRGVGLDPGGCGWGLRVIGSWVSAPVVLFAPEPEFSEEARNAYTQRNKYTSPEHFAISWAIEWRVAVGASMTQRQDLFGAIWCDYPLLYAAVSEVADITDVDYGVWECGNATDFLRFVSIRLSSMWWRKRDIGSFMLRGNGGTRVDPMKCAEGDSDDAGEYSVGAPVLLHTHSRAGIVRG